MYLNQLQRKGTAMRKEGISINMKIGDMHCPLKKDASRWLHRFLLLRTHIGHHAWLHFLQSPDMVNF
jgi:hypothetical protein